MTIKLALAKGRLADETLALLERAGVSCPELKEKSRKLVFHDQSGKYEFIMVKPSDVPTYVDYGVADVGVVGKDTLMEENRPLYELLDLGFGKCRMCVAGFPQRRQELITASHFRVATKYPAIARRYYEERGENVEIIKLNGSVELGPLVGLSDVIVDIVESGATLRANGLEVLETVCDLSARLVVNRVSLKTKASEIKQLIESLREQLGAADGARE